MADGIRIQIPDHSAVIGALGRAAAALRDLEPLLQEIGAVIEAHVDDRFSGKQDPAGNPWAPWAASTVAKYARADGERRRGSLLERTGRMIDSLTHNVTGPGTVEIGFSVEYAQWHESGTKHMPRRGMLLADWQAGTLGADDEAAVLDAIERHLGEALGA